MKLHEFDERFTEDGVVKGELGELIVALIDHISTPLWRRVLMRREYITVLNRFKNVLNVIKVGVNIG